MAISGLFSAKPKSETGLGLDIGSGTVKVVRLTGKGSSVSLDGVGVAGITEDTKAGVITAVKKASEEANVTTNRVVTGVSGQSVIVRYIRVPKMAEEDLSASLKYEAAKHIPFDINDVEMDFQVLDSAAKDTKTMEILLVAAKKDIINERLELLKACNLDTVVIDVNSFAIANAFENALGSVFKKKDNALSLINIGTRMTSINILDNGVSKLTRDVDIGGADKNIISPLISEIRKSFDYYESQAPDKNISAIYLSGGGSQIPQINDIMHKEIGIKTHIWNAVSNLKISDDVPAEKIEKLYPILPVAVGLALRGIK